MVSRGISLKTCVPATMFTPPQLSDEEDEECIKESSNATYERQETHCFFSFGYIPIWE